MAPQAGAAVEGICRASARPCPWPGGLRLLSRSSRHVWPGLWRPHGDLIRLPACAEFMVKCSALGRGTERGSLESRHASPLRPREPARPGPGLGVGVRFFRPHPPVGRVDILAPPGAPQSQNMHFRQDPR